MDEPIQPNREPDFILEIDSKNYWLAFWWDERIQTNNIGRAYEVRLDDELFKFTCPEFTKAFPYSDELQGHIREAYTKWLIEKELGLHG